MGTPEFAVASLSALYDSGCNIVGVITAPDKPAGRGMKLHESAVKKYSLEKGLNILQPEKLKNPDFLNELKKLKADLQIVVAFRMLPEVVWNMPPMGTLNLHGSLLPQYRGAAPINWVLINGEKETGVTTFKLQHEIDTGPILLQEKMTISENETAGDLHDPMKDVGARVLIETVKGLTNGILKETLQEQIGLNTSGEPVEFKHAPKIFTDTCRIDWNYPVEEIFNLVRGLAPFPAAFTELQNKKLKIYSSVKEFSKPSISPGEFETDHRSFLKFACTDGYLHLQDIQLEGKKRMMIADFLRGFRFNN
ncbi:MAG: methionyl-tRNA formyltransferase [Chitinophagaceae bacterium]|nr:methionyl-tRNA formyltransferase [Chitinophagaceae bacterium]